MSNVEMESKIQKMQEWEALANEARADAESLRDEIISIDIKIWIFLAIVIVSHFINALI